MSQIYCRACRVLVWLGEEGDNGEDTGAAFTCIDLLQERAWPRLDELMRWRGSDDKTTSKAAAPTDIDKHLSLPSADSVEFTALHKLFTRPWFFRA